MINATRELRKNLKDFGNNELGLIVRYSLRLTMSVMFPERDFFSIYYNDYLICCISKNSVYLKRSEENERYNRIFYKETKLTKEQVLKIERIAEEWTEKYSKLMI